jgi:hypothetical protein
VGPLQAGTLTPGEVGWVWQLQPDLEVPADALELAAGQDVVAAGVGRADTWLAACGVTGAQITDALPV